LVQKRLNKSHSYANYEGNHGAKLGSAANLHYVRSGQQGTPTFLSCSQIAHLCKKKTSSKNGKDIGANGEGETDDIYKFLKESGNYYVSYCHIQDLYGRVFFVLHSFLPSKQRWAYKWLFETVFPVLIGTEVLSTLSIVVTDGDSQEITQLKVVVNIFFPNVYHIRCLWHIIDRGGLKHVNVPLGGHSHRKMPLHLRGQPQKSSPPLTESNIIGFFLGPSLRIVSLKKNILFPRPFS
jgi:hypothetical protein